MRLWQISAAVVAPWLLFAFADVPAPPAVDQGGVLNAASHMPASLPGAAMARGARFTLSGIRLGPESPVLGSESSPPALLAGVSVRIAQGDTSVEAGLLLVSGERIDGVIPPSAPLGTVRLWVTYDGRTSEPFALTLVESSFGFFSSDTAPTALREAARPISASPGETVTLWGSGLGEGALDLFVGGRPAANVRASAETSCCRGVERVEFQVPRDTPLGCSVPVQGRGPGGRPTNVVSIAIHEPGRPCHDAIDWFRESVAHATRAGFVLLARVLIADPEHPRTVEDRFDYALGSFGRQESGQRPLPPVPPLNTCTLATDRLNLRQLYGQSRSPAAWTSIPKPLAGNRHLEAGLFLSITGPGGAKRIDPDPRRHEYYASFLGGHVPLLRMGPAPLFLETGAYTLTAPGGVDIEPFSVQVPVIRPIVWKNRAQIAEVRRSEGVRVEWTASRKEDAVLIAAASADHFSGDSALCVCMAAAKDGHFTIPALALANLPPSAADADLEGGYLVIVEIPVNPPARIRTQGLDEAFAAFVSASARLVNYR